MKKDQLKWWFEEVPAEASRRKRKEETLAALDEAERALREVRQRLWRDREG